MLASQAAAATGVPATRDPSAVPGMVAGGGVILIGFPTHVDRLLAGPNLEVPVFLMTGAPSDLRAADWLLDHLDAFVAFTGARSVTNGPIEIGTNQYPAVTAMVQLAITTQETEHGH